MTVTSGDVARAAGVSRPAVSMILNGRGRFSTETIQRVEQIAEAMNYRPSPAARALATGTSDIVVALIPDTTFGTNLQDLTDLFTAAFARVGLTLVLRLSSSPGELFEHFIASVRPRAVIAPVRSPTASEVATLAAAKIPLVELSGQIEGGDVNVQIGRRQGEYLTSQGYRSFAYAHLQDTRRDLLGDAREAGFTEHLRMLDLSAAPAVHVGLDLQDAITALRHLPTPVAIACYNDDVAIALLGGARELGRRVPQDVALIGVDATRIGSLMAPRITSVTAGLASARHEIVNATVARVVDPTIPALHAHRVKLAVAPGESA